MEALQYLGIIQVFTSPLLQPCFTSVAQVIIGAMDDPKKFLCVEEYQCFLQLRTSIDFIIENF